jgi:hypothetical protein
MIPRTGPKMRINEPSVLFLASKNQVESF